MTNKEKAQLFRRRYYGRQDVYGRAWKSEKDDGTIMKGYAPVCANFWKPNCHIRLKDGVTCAKCEVKQYSPVTDESVLKHIHGEESQIQYVLMEDGTVRFSAIDWDNKPGKEQMGYNWEDVSKALQVLRGFELPYGVARSTTNGWHTYVFCSEPYPANKMRAIWFEVLERAGFMEEMRQGVRPLPEVFPKQSAGGMGGLGNGIKCAPIEPQFEKERNCFVDDNNHMIPAHLQWDHFAKIPSATPAQLDAIIEKYQIPVFETVSPSSTGSYSSLMMGKPLRRGPWQPPLTGSYEKVLEGCAALRRVRGKWQKKQPMTHHEGFISYWLAMNTADGVKKFIAESGWGTTDSERRQLEQSLEKNYSPPTCAKLQELGVCVKGTKCFDKKPPIDQVEGQTIVRDDLPKEQWPEPSPIRYAFGKGDDFLKKLMEEADQLVSEADASLKAMKLKELVERVQVFDEAQQALFKEHLEKLNLVKRKEANKLFREAGAQKEQEFRETAQLRQDTIVFHNQIYRKLQPFGYAMVRKLQGNREGVDPIFSADIWIREEKHLREEGHTVRSMYTGIAAYDGYEYQFEIDLDEWHSDSGFISYFGKLLGSGFNILKQDVDYLRQAVTVFSHKAGIKKSVYHTSQGWSKDAFLSTSMLFDKDGIRPNTEQPIDISHKQFANRIDFKILRDDEFKEVMFHIKKDLLTAWDPDVGYTALAHTMAAPLITPLQFGSYPSLFLEGDINTGKSALMRLMQYFYGDFPNLLNLIGSSRGSLMDHAHEFKDCLLVLDDFKNLTPYQVQTILQTIQSAYDGGLDGKLTRDGRQRKNKGVRCLLGVTGEMTPENEASMVSRAIILEVRNRSLLNTELQYHRCVQMRHLYNGIIPRFGHWFLQQDIEAIRGDINDTARQIQRTIDGATGADRIARNLSLNLVVWKLWVQFMLFAEVIDHKEAEAYVATHTATIHSVKNSLVLRCSEERHGSAFVRYLQNLILSGQVSIKNLQGFEREHRPVIGFVKPKDETPNRLYLYPLTTMEQVKMMAKSTPIAGTVRSIGRQLVQLGVICETEDGRHQKVVRDGDSTPKVWVVDLTKLDLGRTTLAVVNQTQPLPLPKTDSDGLF